ncbi:hypothetical protein SAMN02799631_03709 [Methylobacterium sp. 174MFSha1.1]|uniref:hypothetical protein n=1 Tax=Methylobacterium sp. 174MFSha1.1 TaxID=1502749 RepID=UPI0008E23071|nr:hypothetical protein [Methylobacterium sp. 174MFSha1.1]SFU99240.1 hypothetical protein SAMN02799631_03709 [Methylobacterium sp. 174MFSha1.1]
MRRGLTYALMAAGALLLVLAGLPVLLVGWMLWSDGRVGAFRDAANADLPGLSVTLERRFAHPFLAEYHRSLTVTQANGGEAKLDIGMDTGGLAHVRVCRSGTGSILVHDALGTTEIATGTTVPSLARRPAFKETCPEFLGAFDVDAKRDLAFTPAVPTLKEDRRP